MSRTTLPVLAAVTIGAGLAAAGAAWAHDLTASPVRGVGPRPAPVHTMGFISPESALVPDGWDMAVVSNQNGPEPGFLALLNLDGTVEEMHWVEGLDNPTGMRAFGDTLWVANGTEIVSVDMEAAEITGHYPCPDAQFVNDIATGPDGTVYGSESFGGGIFMIAPGSDQCEWFVEGGDERLNILNGLYGAEDALMVVTIPGNVLSVDYQTGELTQLGSGIGSLDGIEPFGDHGWLLSDTNGKILHFHDGEAQVLIDSSGAGFGANDMAFHPESGTAFLARAGFGMISLYHVEEAE